VGGGVQTRNIGFVENGFTGHVDSIFVQYSATNNFLPNSNDLHLRGNISKVDRIWQPCEISFHPFLITYFVHVLFLSSLLHNLNSVAMHN
jgi:hypothetical protein